MVTESTLPRPRCDKNRVEHSNVEALSDRDVKQNRDIGDPCALSIHPSTH